METKQTCQSTFYCVKLNLVKPMTAMFSFARDIHLPFQLGLDSVQKYDGAGPK